MYISNIKLWNFRKFGSDNEINLDQPNIDLNLHKGLNVIIGENDSGKSAIIDAIKLVLKTHSYDYIRVEDKDFFNGTSRLRIEITFSDLIANEAKNFLEWISWTGEGTNAIAFLKLIYDVKKQGDRLIPSDVKAGADIDGYPLTFEAREYLKVTYLKPLRDAENDLVSKRNSRLSQILLGDEAFKGKKNEHELVKVFETLSGELKNYFKGEFVVKIIDELGKEYMNKPQDGKKIKDKIDGYIKDFFGNNYETEFEVASNDIKSILEKLTLLLLDERNSGLGTLNRLYMAAELLHLNKTNWSGIRVGLIEELEAHLHPQAQMQVIESLQKQRNIQLILTTHSPNLASKVKLKNLVICNKSNAFSMGSKYTKLDPSQYIFLEKFLDTTKANLFFAKGVILVEGWAEEILIPSISKNIGIDLTEKGVSVVNIGNTAFNHYSKIFLRKNGPNMKIPVSVVTDSDIKEYVRSKDLNGKYTYTKRDINTILNETNNKINQIEGNSECNVRFFVAPKWTFEYCLFKSPVLSNIFKETIKNIHSDTDWDSDFELELAKKLLNRSLNKTEIAYKLAKIIDENDDIADIDDNIESEIITKTLIKIETANQKDPICYLINAIKYASGI